MRRTPGDRLGGNSSLTICWSSQRQHGFLTREHVLYFDDIAHRPDARIGSSHLGIDDNAAARADLQTGIPGQRGLGPHSDGQDDEIGGQARAALRDDDQAAAALLFNGRKPVA